jgi:hypothetical protein
MDARFGTGTILNWKHSLEGKNRQKPLKLTPKKPLLSA